MQQEFAQQIKDSMKRYMSGIHTAVPGTITDFDPSKCVASVKPAMLFKKPDRNGIEYPEISGVPVVFPQSSGQKVTYAFPIKAGDGCLIIISEQSLDYWMYGQETDTDLRFDLSNAMCIPGLFTSANPVVEEACNTDSAIIDVEGTRMTIKKDETVLDVEGTKVTVRRGDVTISGPTTIQGDLIVQGAIIN